jgi:hypothetical protein
MDHENLLLLPDVYKSLTNDTHLAIAEWCLCDHDHVRKWFCSPTSKSHRIPSLKDQRLLYLAYFYQQNNDSH